MGWFVNLKTKGQSARQVLMWDKKRSAILGSTDSDRKPYSVSIRRWKQRVLMRKGRGKLYE